MFSLHSLPVKAVQAYIFKVGKSNLPNESYDGLSDEIQTVQIRKGVREQRQFKFGRDEYCEGEGG